jgi:glycosyltransferase involved in cell wall biosynthesis
MNWLKNSCDGNIMKENETGPHRVVTKVLYFSSEVHIQGGAVQSMFRLARWSKQQGNRPVVVLPREGDIAKWYAQEGIDVRIMPFVEMHRRWSAAYFIRYLFSTICIIARLVALIKREQVDIVHVNEIVYFPGLIAGKIAGAKTVCHVRVILEKPAWARRMLSWLVSRFSDQVLCVADAVRTKMFPPGMRHVRTLYNPGPDLDRFDLQAVEGEVTIRQQLGIAPDAFVVGLVSKFSPSKGHLALVEAARVIKTCQPNSRITYLLVGGAVVGKEDYLGQVCNIIRQYGLKDSFVITGARSDVPRLISACDVTVHLPLHQDPFPGVVLEAMAMEKPLVAFTSGGIPEQFEDGRSGILLEQNNIEALAGTLLNLANDKASRLRIGKAARLFLTSHFSFEKFFSELDTIYHSLCKLSGTPGIKATSSFSVDRNSGL